MMNTLPAELQREVKKGDTRIDLCAKHGEFEEVYIAYGYWSCRGGWSGCKSCLSDYQAAVAAADKRRFARQRSASCLTSSSVPTRHRRKSFKNFDSQNDDQRAALQGAELYVENFTEHLLVGRCLGFIGPPGVGKSHLSCAILLALAELGYSVRYTTASNLVYDIRNTWNRASEETTSSVLDEFCGYELLLIDDVGCLSAELEHVRHIIEQRYNEQLPTMITSNLGTQDLGSFIDVRGLDRLRENGGLMFALSGTSRRAIAESTIVEEPVWWEKYLSRSAVTRREIDEEEEAMFSVRLQDYPGIWMATEGQ